MKTRAIRCEKELYTLGRKVSYKSHSGIIRAESRYFCSLGRESSGLEGRSLPEVASEPPQA